MKALTLKEAVDLSIEEKWEPIVEQGGEINIEDEPICWLCNYHINLYFNCDSCPLHDEDIDCCYEYSKWKEWLEDRPKDHPRREKQIKFWATKLLNRLYELRLCMEEQGVD